MPSSRVRGGKKFAAFVREFKRAQRERHVIDVGFHDRAIAALAGQLEYGNPKTNLPERPAFRQGIGDLKRSLVGEFKGVVSAHDLKRGLVFDKEDAASIGKVAAETIRSSYLTFHGEGLSETQEARKRGTPGAGKELIGHEGPKLIGHIGAKVDGEDAE